MRLLICSEKGIFHYSRCPYPNRKPIRNRLYKNGCQHIDVDSILVVLTSVAPNVAWIVHLYLRITGETSKIQDSPSTLITLVSSGCAGCEDH